MCISLLIAQRKKCRLKSTTTNGWRHFGQSEHGKSSVLFLIQSERSPDSGFFACDLWKDYIYRRRPRGGQSGGRRGATKVFKHRRKSPWVPFPNGQANAGSWLGTKNALYYCAQSANSISWVLFVSSYKTAIISPHLPSSFTKLSYPETKELPMIDKRFGCYQQKQFNLHRGNSVSDGSQCIVNNRTFKMKRRRESKKSNSLTRQNNNFARASRFFVHFFAVTARLPRENAQFHVSWRT